MDEPESLSQNDTNMGMATDAFIEQNAEEEDLYLEPNNIYGSLKCSGNNGNSYPDKSQEVKEKNPKKIEQLTYLDLCKPSKKDVECLIHHPPKFGVPIYQHPNFENYDLREQVKLLCGYHTKMSRNLVAEARLQIKSVPLPKPIQSSPKCTNSLSKNSDDYRELFCIDTLENSPTDESYVSRAGRITKRKFYTEAAENEMKKLKMGESVAKSTTSKTSRAKKNQHEEESRGHSSSPNVSLKNAEIMQRSSLFKDSPSKSNRLAKIADGVEQKKMKDKEEEDKLDKFQMSLSSDEFFDLEESVGRRVSPPLPNKSKKGGKLKKPVTQYEELKHSVQKAKQNSIDDKRNGKPQNQRKENDSTKSENSRTPGQSRKTHKAMIKCPICSKEFGEKDIEEHASSCGEQVETRSQTSELISLTCGNCDEVFMSEEHLENHKSKC